MRWNLRVDPPRRRLLQLPVVAAVSLWLIGCMSTREPPSAEPGISLSLPVVVGVRGDSKEEVEHLVEDLRATGLFASVFPNDEVDGQSHLIATLEYENETPETEFCATHAAQEWGLASLLTLLVLPAHVCDLGYEILFSGAAAESPVRFTFDYRSDSFTGPYFLPMLVLDRWTWGTPSDALRRDHLSHQLAEIVPELRSLLVP